MTASLLKSMAVKFVPDDYNSMTEMLKPYIGRTGRYIIIALTWTELQGLVTVWVAGYAGQWGQVYDC